MAEEIQIIILQVKMAGLGEGVVVVLVVHLFRGELERQDKEMLADMAMVLI